MIIDKKAGNETKSSLNSAVTTDMPNKAAEAETSTVDLTKVTIPTSAITPPAPKVETGLTDEDEADLKARDASFETRANDAGIGLIRVDGIDFRYVGVAPARDKDPKTPGGYPITNENSTFTPLANTVFHPSVRIKDPKSGTFYYPADGASSYELVEYEGNRLIAKEVDKAASKARRDGLVEFRKR